MSSLTEDERAVPAIPQLIPAPLDRPSTYLQVEPEVALQASAVRAATRKPHSLSGSRNLVDLSLEAITFLAAAVILGVLILMIVSLLIRSWPAITAFGFSFFNMGQTAEIPFSPKAAALGTLYSSILALLLATPLGVLIAIFLTQIAPAPVRLGLGFTVELLAAVPSIVIGLWGLFFLAPIIVGQNIVPFVYAHGWSPFTFFAQASTSGQSMLAASVVLAIMILPTIAAISRDVLLTVPTSQREAMLALGATRWETTWKVLIPYCRAGIIGAVLLGLGRALGETMAVQMVIGNSQTGQTPSVLQIATTMPATIVSQFSDAFGGLYLASLLELALVLLVMTIALNAVARILVWSITRKYAS